MTDFSPFSAESVPVDPGAAETSGVSGIRAEPMTDSATSEQGKTAAPASAGPPPTTQWEPLTPLERRILGVLIEKQKTVEYIYPLSMTHLLLGCNQKQNRDPIMQVTEEEAEATLQGLIRKGLVEEVPGGRVVHYRHKLYEKWTAEAKELAILAELLLRGAQNRGWLRLRASRMDKIPTLEELDSLLYRMAERGLVVFLTPPGRRGTIVTHGFHTPEELTQLAHARLEDVKQDIRTPSRAAIAPSTVHRTPTTSTRSSSLLTALQEQVTSLTATVEQLQQLLNRLEALLNRTNTSIESSSSAE